MLKSHLKPFEKTQDLIKVYRTAFEKAKYLKDYDEKILAFNEVINYCASSKTCVEEDSLKRNQILFWTYNNIGDIFLEKNNSEINNENYIYALQYYQNAIEFLNSAAEKKNILEKISHIYLELQDEKSWRKTLEQMALLEGDDMKRHAFVNLANTTDDIKLQSQYLENALNYVIYENISFLEKCKNTLYICERLLSIYEQTSSTSDYDRIKMLQKNTLGLLN